MSSILITGCNRGLGLEFCKQLLAHSKPPGVLIATCRNPDAAEAIIVLIFNTHGHQASGLALVIKHQTLAFAVNVPETESRCRPSSHKVARELMSLTDQRHVWLKALQLKTPGFHKVYVLLGYLTAQPKLIVMVLPNIQALQALSKQHSNLHILKLSVLDFDSFDTVAQKVRDIVGDKGLNILINNAGILRQKKDSLSLVNAKDMTDTYLTNTVAPVLLIKAFRHLLKQAADYNKDKVMGWSRAAVVNISSFLGSISRNTSGDFLEYRESKAALNMASRSIALELHPEGILLLNIHPGWVKTDMGTSAAELEVKDSVRGMLRVCYALKREYHGTFLQWDGKFLPW